MALTEALQWYQFARNKSAHDVDDFDQINDDLRPFWALSPSEIRRSVSRSHLGTATISIRNHNISSFRNCKGAVGWRSDSFHNITQSLMAHLPDMTIAYNCLDQPRLVVPYETIQGYLEQELGSRGMAPDAVNAWSPISNLTHIVSRTNGTNYTTEELPDDVEWKSFRTKQFMEIGSTACPPDSVARTPSLTTAESESRWKTKEGGFVTNFNLSSDLCTMGREIEQQHGYLFASASSSIGDILTPIFSECKVSVNNDILFPALMYWGEDKRYFYVEPEEQTWAQKLSKLIWRGATAGGVADVNNYFKLHRQRMVQMLNSTEIVGLDQEVPILSTADEGKTYQSAMLQPAKFAEEHTNVAFTSAMYGCVPEGCSIYDQIFRKASDAPFEEQFRYKYLIDVDGQSFSGRWRAFLQSKSLGIKSTIFREWHDQRLMAWRHFVPMDNRYDDLYGILTYFIGINQKLEGFKWNKAVPVVVPSHDDQAKQVAAQGSQWSRKVLRREDMEIYMLRLLLEYRRIVDDNRLNIGYAGDGSEMDAFDAAHPLRWED